MVNFRTSTTISYNLSTATKDKEGRFNTPRLPAIGPEMFVLEEINNTLLKDDNFSQGSSKNDIVSLGEVS